MRNAVSTRTAVRYSRRSDIIRPSNDKHLRKIKQVLPHTWKGPFTADYRFPVSRIDVILILFGFSRSLRRPRSRLRCCIRNRTSRHRYNYMSTTVHIRRSLRRRSSRLRCCGNRRKSSRQYTKFGMMLRSIRYRCSRRDPTSRLLHCMRIGNYHLRPWSTGIPARSTGSWLVAELQWA